MAPGVRHLSITSSTVFALGYWYVSRRFLASRQDGRWFRGWNEERSYGDFAGARATNLPISSQLLVLPKTCPGCGAHAQLVNSQEAGYYTRDRKSVRNYLLAQNRVGAIEDLQAVQLFDHMSAVVDEDIRSQLGVAEVHESAKAIPGSNTPVCNRCHELVHHFRGVSVTHPSMQSLQEIILESPHKYNHIYHILDAADFPLSLIPNLQRRLALTPQRSQNRRAKTSQFYHGRATDISFIITRADLLAPRKEQVDSLMPYLVQVLRDALGESAANVRLGNVRCVSAKRGWWTSHVKEEIWNRGGGGWMVGKVNVGKSNLIENVFPKGRADNISVQAVRNAARKESQLSQGLCTPNTTISQGNQPSSALYKEGSGGTHDLLLPPAAPEIPFPVLPVVSSLPGTTASPIRLPFGNGKGELVDLPGLDRGGLETYVLAERKQDLVMCDRPKPRQRSIKPGQSLLVGGLVRITPLTDNVTLLAYPFVPLKSHVASTERIIAITKQEESFGNVSIARSGIGNRIASAGRYSMKWDVTKQRAGPLVRKDAAGLPTEVLPFVVLSMDVLIEGCGWVELVAQMRKKDLQNIEGTIGTTGGNAYPQIEIASPGGRHIGVRRPMNAWLLHGHKPGSSKPTKRPRRSMKGVKKRLKRTLST